MDLEIIEIASNTENHKVLKNSTHASKLKNPICGDEMQINLKVVNENIKDFGYQCKSCVYCQASASLLSRNSINKSIKKIKDLLNIVEIFFHKKENKLPDEWSVFNKLFDKKNISRKDCLLLPFRALSRALKL